MCIGSIEKASIDHVNCNDMRKLTKGQDKLFSCFVYLLEEFRIPIFFSRFTDL